eukprot:gb/GECH01003036.1/.p1 GENE.gb/GECH01003036.1/~~gb/GECH01003036.1/.p1  ORF type:complete len:359 (+),score=149.51 gb/GECH01003036.1/:1-1077(+)
MYSIFETLRQKSEGVYELYKNDLSEFAQTITEDVKSGVSLIAEEGNLTPTQISLTRNQRLLNELRSSPETYTEPITDDEKEQYLKWEKEHFNLDEKTDEISQLLENNPEMEVLHREKIGENLSYEQFWKRYFFREHRLKEKEEQRQHLKNLAKQASQSVDEDRGNEDLREEILKLRQRVEELNQINISLVEQSQKTSAELDDLVEREEKHLEENDDPEKSKLVRFYKNRVETLQTEKEELNQEISDYKSKVTKLTAKLAAFENRSSREQELESKVKELTKRLKEKDVDGNEKDRESNQSLKKSESDQIRSDWELVEEEEVRALNETSTENKDESDDHDKNKEKEEVDDEDDDDWGSWE